MSSVYDWFAMNTWLLILITTAVIAIIASWFFLQTVTLAEIDLEVFDYMGKIFEFRYRNAIERECDAELRTAADQKSRFYEKVQDRSEALERQGLDQGEAYEVAWNAERPAWENVYFGLYEDEETYSDTYEKVQEQYSEKYDDEIDDAYSHKVRENLIKRYRSRNVRIVRERSIFEKFVAELKSKFRYELKHGLRLKWGVFVRGLKKKFNFLIFLLFFLTLRIKER